MLLDTLRTTSPHLHLPIDVRNLLPDMLATVEQLDLDDNGDSLLPSHTDLFHENFLDDGARLAVLDFDYLGVGRRAWDALSFPAWEAFDADGNLRLSDVAAYLRGYREISGWSPDPARIADLMAFLNLAENLYNLDKVRQNGAHGYPHYLANWQRARQLLAHRHSLACLWHA